MTNQEAKDYASKRLQEILSAHTGIDKLQAINIVIQELMDRRFLVYSPVSGNPLAGVRLTGGLIDYTDYSIINFNFKNN